MHLFQPSTLPNLPLQPSHSAVTRLAGASRAPAGGRLNAGVTCGLVFLVLSWVLGGVSASACQCGSFPGPAEAATKSAAVFEGRVESVWPVSYVAFFGPTVGLSYTFTISRVWKGAPGRTLTLVHEGTNCGFFFRAGTTYLVYAIPHRSLAGRMTSTICLPTKEIGRASGDLSVLGPAASLGGLGPFVAEAPMRRLVRRVVASALVGWLSIRHAGSTESADHLRVMLTSGLCAVLLAVLLVRMLVRRQFAEFLLVLAGVTALLVGGVVAHGYSLITTTPPGYLSLLLE
jgi:hypothetical protein